ncbi:hypothetical protein GH714_029361 [Hevea brasiliensis]|uniref:Pectate lyase superfamily protein domain-containing protein n=1 Tax=Hevea brasiliensis TaxID=3981 RepID=A0A6A6KD35_HEVBR|nr:hypothetical protein GH714_029361 [Hevea brasiliensis]
MKQQNKLREMEAKLQEIAAAEATLYSFASLLVSETKQKIGRVLYPTGYGADPSGEEESSDAILKALNDAFQLQNGLELLPGINDLGGVVIDLQGGNYKISKPIRFPAAGGANIEVKGGTLRASDTFPEDRHLIEVWSPNSKPLDNSDSIHDLPGTEEGIFIIDSARIRINNCFFVHFTTQGILVQKGHETFISSCFLGQHSTVGGDKGERDFSGTAIELASNDNAITDVAIFSAAIGVLLKGQANILTGIHCYNKATFWGGIGVLVKQFASLTRIDNCYLDYNSVVIEDPVQVHVTDGLFLGDGNVVLKAIKGKISGVNIVNNMFNGNPKNMVPIVRLDGIFTSVDQVVIDKNNVNGMSLKSTTGRQTVAGNGTRWAADFSSLLIFPDMINHFQFSFYSSEKGLLPVHAAVTNVSNNVVVVESDKAVNGVVSIVVDQYNMVGEGIVFM